MIITKLKGGLGNQLFQYAAGLAKSIEKNETLKLDLSNYAKDRKRIFSLLSFNISAKKAAIFEIILTKILHRSSYLDDYFQSEEYFKNIAEIIQREFSPKESLQNKYPELIQQITGSDSVSVHIRRTDYLDKQHRYRILDGEYYKQAISLVDQKTGNPTYFFFSDDIEWVKSNIEYPENSVFVSKKDWEDLVLMSLCKHNIIANSTFSWWAAWLNQNPDKIVVSPQKWFNTGNGAGPLPLSQKWTVI